MTKLYQLLTVLLLSFCFLFSSGCGDKECSGKDIGKAMNNILADDIEFIYTINTITCSFPKKNILRLETKEEIDEYIATFQNIFSEIKPYNPQSKKIKSTYESFINCFNKIKRNNIQIDRLSSLEGKRNAEKRLKEAEEKKAEIFEKFNQTFTPNLYKAKGDYYQELKSRLTTKLQEYCHISLIDPDKKELEEIYQYALPVWEKEKSKKLKSADSDQVCLDKADVFFKTFITELVVSIGNGI